MDKDKLEDCLKNIFNSITIEEKNKSQELIKETLVKIKDSGYKLSNPEHFNLFVMHKLKNGVKEIANAMHDKPSNGVKDTYKPNFIYLNYDFLEQNLRELCELREGSACCADKSRFIIEMYLKYSLTGEILDFDPNKENYWTPNFGTYNQWIDLCDGLYDLYYGKTKKYFEAYNSLIQADIRKYKHILHHWYIRFKDGETIKFNSTWDKRDENPLDNESFDKSDYYIIHGNYVKDRGYEVFEDEDFINNHYYKVPKCDIDEIYKVSEEKMV